MSDKSFSILRLFRYSLKPLYFSHMTLDAYVRLVPVIFENTGKVSL